MSHLKSFWCGLAGHMWGDWEYSQADSGERIRRCSRCGMESSGQEVGRAPVRRIRFNYSAQIRFDLPGHDKLEEFLYHRFDGRGGFFREGHGYPHWVSVYDNADRLLSLLQGQVLSQRLRRITLLGAYLHDVGRLIHDREDAGYQGKHHSARSELFIEKHLPTLALRLSEADVRSICLLARGHFKVNRDIWSRAEQSGLKTSLKIVRDADALDRIRFDGLNTRFLHLPESHSLIDYITAKWQAGFKME